MPDPNNIIVPGHDLIFMCIPKAANTSIKVAIMDALGMTGNPHSVFRACTKQEAQKTSAFKIAFVRNPIARLRSCYIDKVINNNFPAFKRCGIDHRIEFEEFVDIVCCLPDDKSDQHFRSQHYELYENGECVPDFVGKVERISRDWEAVKKICSGYGLNLPDLKTKNATNSGFKIQDNLLYKIKTRYKNDLKVFNYE